MFDLQYFLPHSFIIFIVFRVCQMKKDYLEEGAMADTADLVVLGAYYGTGNKGKVNLIRSLCFLFVCLFCFIFVYFV